jgi:CheY-like chemotaxis protein
LQQIVMNLILNASEAIPADRQGIVVVRADLERIHTPRSTWSGDLAPGDYVGLEVRDNGSGIDPALFNRIFDPFFTTKFTGRGLGLAAVHGIIRSHKGSIVVSSTPGNGSTFRVLLPAGEPVADSVKTAGAAYSPAQARTRGHILVVDDEPVVGNVAKVILEHSGHTVEVVSSGQEAVERLAAPPGFSLVLLDLNMPGLDGRQTLQAIRRTHADLPVLICSGYGDSEVRGLFPCEAVHGFLQKPFHLQTVAETVAGVLSRA